MRDVTLRQLRIFAAVARNLSFSRAAHQLRLTQPAVSMQVKELEAQAGLPLLERHGRVVRLTQAGEELLRHAQQIEQALLDAGEGFARLRGLRAGRVAIAAVSTAKYFAPRLLARFGREHPDVTLALAVHNREAVVRMLQADEVDLALMGTPPPDVDAVAEPFAPHPLVVVAHPAHPLVARRRVAPALLQDERFLVREPGSGTRAAMERFFATHGLRPAEAMEITSNETIKQAVMAGLGLGFVSLHAIGLELAAGQLALLRVEGLPIVRAWNVVHRRERQLEPAPEAFRRFVLEEGRGFLQHWPAALVQDAEEAP